MIGYHPLHGNTNLEIAIDPNITPHSKHPQNEKNMDASIPSNNLKGDKDLLIKDNDIS
jgi:hypothetical protein